MCPSGESIGVYSGLVLWVSIHYHGSFRRWLIEDYVTSPVVLYVNGMMYGRTIHELMRSLILPAKLQSWSSGKLGNCISLEQIDGFGSTSLSNFRWPSRPYSVTVPVIRSNRRGSSYFIVCVHVCMYVWSCFFRPARNMA